jgi:hypothetical protein
MGGMDGGDGAYPVLQNASRTFSPTSIIALTAHASASIRLFLTL